MPEQRVAPHQKLPPAVRWSSVGLLVLALLLLGVFNNVVILFFTALWRQGLAVVGLGQVAGAIQQDLGNNMSARFLPAAATYTVLYLSLCLLLLRLLLIPVQWRFAVQLYAGALVVFIAMMLLTKLVGGAEWARRLSRDFLDFVVSPLPIAGLYVLFRTGFGPQPRQPTS